VSHRAEAAVLMRSTTTWRFVPIGSVRQTAGRSFVAERSSNGNDTSTTLPRVVEGLAIGGVVEVGFAGGKSVVLDTAGCSPPKNFLHRRAGRLRWPASEANVPDDSPERSSLGRLEIMGRERHAESGLNRSGDRLFELPSQERFVPRCRQRPATAVYPDLRYLISQHSTLNHKHST